MKRFAAGVVVLLWAASGARADVAIPPPPPPPPSATAALVGLALGAAAVFAGVWLARRSRASATVEPRT